MANKLTPRGSITRTPGGRYMARAYVGVDPTTGREVRLKQTARTPREAQQWLAKILSRKDTGDHVRPGQHRLGEWLEEYSETYVAAKSARRRFDFDRRMGRYIPQELRARRLVALTPADCARLFTRLQAQGLSPATVRHIRGDLRQALNRAVKDGLVPRNVVQLTDAPALVRPEHRWLTAEEMRLFLAEAARDPYAGFFTVLLCEGLRPGEAYGLQWPDWEEAIGRLTVRRAVDPMPGAGRAFKLPKTGKARTLTLTPASQRALLAQRAAQAKVRLALGQDVNPLKLIFPATPRAHPDGTLRAGPLLHDVVTGHFRRIIARVALRLTGTDAPAPGMGGQTRRQYREAKKAYDAKVAKALRTTGLDRLRLYDLRHSSATLGLDAGEYLKTVSERLGHSTIKLTADTYAHVQESMKRRSADAREALLFGPTTAAR
jgi:integrase